MCSSAPQGQGLHRAVSLATTQVGPWCVPLPEGSRICHVRSNMGLDWAQNVLPELEALSARPSDIMVRLLPGQAWGCGLFYLCENVCPLQLCMRCAPAEECMTVALLLDQLLAPPVQRGASLSVSGNPCIAPTDTADLAGFAA